MENSYNDRTSSLKKEIDDLDVDQRKCFDVSTLLHFPVRERDFAQGMAYYRESRLHLDRRTSITGVSVNSAVFH